MSQTIDTEDTTAALVAEMQTNIAKVQSDLRQNLDKIKRQIDAKKAELSRIRWVDPKTARQAIMDTIGDQLADARDAMMKRAEFACLAKTHANMTVSSGINATGESMFNVISKPTHDALVSELAPYDLSAIELASLVITQKHLEQFADHAIAKTGCAGEGQTPAEIEKRTAQLAKEIAELEFQFNRAAKAAERLMGSELVGHRPEPAAPVVKEFDPYAPEILLKNGFYPKMRAPDPGASVITVTDASGNDITREGRRTAAHLPVNHGPAGAPAAPVAEASEAPQAFAGQMSWPGKLGNTIKGLPSRLGLGNFS